MAVITIKSIRTKITELKRTRRVRQRFLQIQIISDMLSLIETRLGSDVEVTEVADALGEEDKSDREELEELERLL